MCDWHEFLFDISNSSATNRPYDESSEHIHRVTSVNAMRRRGITMTDNVSRGKQLMAI